MPELSTFVDVSCCLSEPAPALGASSFGASLADDSAAGASFSAASSSLTGAGVSFFDSAASTASSCFFESTSSWFFCAFSASAESSEELEPAEPPMTARSAPTGTVSSSATRIFVSLPATGEGTSVSTLSVETSSRGSSTATSSPSDLSQRVIVPSVTDSPSAGIVTFSPPETSAAESFEEFELSDACGALSAASSFISSASACGSASCESSEEESEPESDDAGASPSPMTARSAPTGTVSSSSTRISCSVPAIGDGISVSTLSVETSSSGSSTATVSPTFFSQRVTVPSVTDSPRAGMVTRSDMGGGLLNPKFTLVSRMKL